jgi:hypothetical protein
MRKTTILFLLAAIAPLLLAQATPVNEEQHPLRRRVKSVESDGILSSGCPRVCLDVYQEVGTVGLLRPVGTPQTVVDFYNYSHYTFNGENYVPLKSKHSLIFIHEDTRRCDLALVIVHSSKVDSDPGHARMLISGNLEHANVMDGRNGRSDFYLYHPKKDMTECSWTWNWQQDKGKKFRTDGIANQWDLNERECLTVSAQFIQGITAWQFVPGPLGKNGSTDPDSYLDLNMEQTVFICKAGCDDSSEDEEELK